MWCSMVTRGAVKGSAAARLVGALHFHLPIFLGTLLTRFVFLLCM